MSHRQTWHDIDIEEVFDKTNSSISGLTDEDAVGRLKEYGANELEGDDPVNAWTIPFSQFRNPLMMILTIAAIISVIADQIIETVVIVLVIVANTTATFIQEFRAEKSMQALKSMVMPEAKVLRQCGEEVKECLNITVKVTDVVPGDVILLAAGDKVPADARLFEVSNLEVDESMLTGESLTVRKRVGVFRTDTPMADRKNIVYSGTIIIQGRAKAVVFDTGMETEIGKIAQFIGGTERVDTPLQMRTRDLSVKFGIFALTASVLAMIIGLMRGSEPIDAVLFSLATAVSAIPEGLLVAMTITLAVGGSRLARKNAIVRRLQAVETLGSVTTISTDKTGTLTTNQMTVRRTFMDGRWVEVTGAGFEPKGEFRTGPMEIDVENDEALSKLLLAGLLCNDARLKHEVEQGTDVWSINGDPTEGALIVAAEKAGMSAQGENYRYPRIDEIPFDPSKRYMVTFHEARDEVLIQAKGGPEQIIKMCSTIYEDGKARPMTDEDRNDIIENSLEMAGGAMRVMAMAYSNIGKDKVQDAKDSIYEGSNDLTFLGIMGMIDPPRPETKGAIKTAKAAGIRVIMCTGDHRSTAEAIAVEIGIIGKGERVIDGNEIDLMDDLGLSDVLKEASVFARVSPEHKHRIVLSLKDHGEIVAMTGDGVNDAPALKAADVGISMGISGTDVTKETSDVVLTDDNFATIVSAVEEGRVIFSNIQKVVKYLVATNVGEVITIISSLIILYHAPLILTPVMILFINLATDGLLDKTLAVEPGEKNIMNEPPRPTDAKLIDKGTLLNILYVGAVMSIGTLFIFDRTWTTTGNEAKAVTMAFVTMAMFQVFNALNCRSKTQSIFQLGLSSNRYMMMSLISSPLLLFIATYVPQFQAALGTVALGWMDWLTVILLTSTILIADEVRKYLHRLSRRDDSIYGYAGPPAD